MEQRTQEVITSLITSLSRDVPLEIRAKAEQGTALEAVCRRHDLPQLSALLISIFGPPLKPFDQPVRLSRAIQAVIYPLGGIRREQCLFLKWFDTQHAGYATLWPWKSDPDCVTVKIGVLNSPAPVERVRPQGGPHPSWRDRLLRWLCAILPSL